MPDDARLPTPAIAGHRSILRDPTRFEFTQRVARLYSESQLVPKHLQGKLADCFIALQMADAMDEDPLMVMQNIFIVNARAGWSAQYMIARANRSGNFRGPLRWRTDGEGDALAVTCYADLAHVDEGETRVEVTVSMAMAKADGWTRNEKYKSIPEQMLRWRSATWLIRLYCPEVMMGLPSAEEAEDTWGDHLKGVTPPRPELHQFADKPAPPKRTRTRAAEPSNEAAKSDTPVGVEGMTTEEHRATESLDPAKLDPGSEPAKPYFVSDQYGEVHEFEDYDEAVAVYAEQLEAAKGDETALVAAWDNGAQLLSVLRERGHHQAADALNNEYGRLLDEARAPSASPGAGAAEPAKPSEAPASAGQLPLDDYNVVVAFPEGMSANEWFKAARAKLIEMTGARRPAADFARFPEANQGALQRLKNEMPAWRNLLAREIDKGAQL
jgi:hypothetical protein